MHWLRYVFNTATIEGSDLVAQDLRYEILGHWTRHPGLISRGLYYCSLILILFSTPAKLFAELYGIMMLDGTNRGAKFLIDKLSDLQGCVGSALCSGWQRLGLVRNFFSPTSQPVALTLFINKISLCKD